MDYPDFRTDPAFRAKLLLAREGGMKTHVCVFCKIIEEVCRKEYNEDTCCHRCGWGMARIDSGWMRKWLDGKKWLDGEV